MAKTTSIYVRKNGKNSTVYVENSTSQRVQARLKKLKKKGFTVVYKYTLKYGPVKNTTMYLIKFYRGRILYRYKTMKEAREIVRDLKVADPYGNYVIKREDD